MIKKIMNHIFNKYFKSKVTEMLEKDKDKKEKQLDQISEKDLDELISSRIMLEDTRTGIQTDLTVMSVMQVYTTNRVKKKLKTKSIIRLIGANNDSEVVESIDLTKYHRFVIIESGVVKL